jgi:hypothetical protein
MIIVAKNFPDQKIKKKLKNVAPPLSSGYCNINSILFTRKCSGNCKPLSTKEQAG